MTDKDKIELLTALVDGEIHEPVIQKELESLISVNRQAAFEFEVQMLMKRLVQQKIGFIKAPEKLQKKVKRKLRSETEPIAGNTFPNLFSKPYLTYATASVILLAVLLIIFNRPPLEETYNFAAEQNGANNMFIQSQTNFKLIMDGTLKPQLISDNPEAIKEFFDESGVKYSTVIPEFSDLKLIGAVVSDEKGKKCAHHVYSDIDNKLVYLYQVDKTSLIEGSSVTLTNDLIKYLESGSCYTSTNNNVSTLFVMAKNNIFAIVSDISKSKLKQSFCNLD